MIAISVVSASVKDNTMAALTLAERLPAAARILIVEFPCLGIPRLAYRLQQGTPTTHNIDQWLLELDHHPKASVFPYIVRTDRIHYLWVNPSSRMDRPVSQRLQNDPTMLQAPNQLRKQLEKEYDYMIWILQGTLIHPMTYAAVCSADAVVFPGADVMELQLNQKWMQELLADYRLDPQRLFLLQEYELLDPDVPQLSIDYSEVVQRVRRLTRQESYTLIQPAALSGSGMIQLYPGCDQSAVQLYNDLSSGSGTPVYFTNALEEEQGQLSFVLDIDKKSTLPHPDFSSTDLKLYLQVKQIICKEGVLSASALTEKLSIRRQRILFVLQQLAAEGMIQKQGSGKGYELLWDHDQREYYLRSFAPVPVPVPNENDMSL